MTRRLILSLLAISLALPSAFAMGKRPEKNRLTFHLEGDVTDGPKMVFDLQMGNKKRFFTKSPLTFTKELTSLKHFITADGTYGATFTFTKAATSRIAAFTTQNQGKWLVAMLNGRSVDAVYVDSPVRDGRLVIWQGIKQVEIIRFEYAMPLTGETEKEWKTRLKGHEKQRKAAQKEAKEAQKERNRRKS
ncbi:MAG: hypothetical protein ACJAQT_004058 [Akkermansiaceae bacterium]|jgi:hypothetical protein